MSFKYKLGFIGCGNMAQAIINGVINSNILDATNIIASHHDKNKEINISNIAITTDNDEVCSNSEILFIAIKPQVFRGIGAELIQKCKAKYIISMMAGINSDSIQKYVQNNVKVIRIMPNTPCKIGKGVTAMQKVDINAVDKNYIKSIIRATGSVVEVEEDLFDAVVAVSGSGPAYIFMVIRALIEGGIAHGLDENAARDLAINMVIGAGELAKKGGNIDDMINAVCSKGGTTIEAVKYYEDNKLEEIIKGGMDKCYARSKELSQE